MCVHLRAGFEGVSGKSRRVYRVESLTGLAFLVRRGFPAQGWCERRFEQRPEGSPSGGDSLSPDASRVVRLSDMPLEVEASSEVFEALVARGRVTDMQVPRYGYSHLRPFLRLFTLARACRRRPGDTECRSATKRSKCVDCVCCLFVMGEGVVDVCGPSRIARFVCVVV